MPLATNDPEQLESRYPYIYRFIVRGFNDEGMREYHDHLIRMMRADTYKPHELPEINDFLLGRSNNHSTGDYRHVLAEILVLHPGLADTTPAFVDARIAAMRFDATKFTEDASYRSFTIHANVNMIVQKSINTPRKAALLLAWAIGAR